MRRLLAVILLLSFFCQAFATARQLVVFDHEGEFRAAHAEMHLEGSAHHHDEHGVAHQDDSPESIQHMLADAGPELLVRGIRVGKDRVRNLMKPHGIRARTKRKFVATTDSKHSLPVAPDLVQRRFNPEAPNQLWSGGITYIATEEGWLYLAAVIDLFSRQVVGWSLQPHMQTSLVKDALAMAWWRRRPESGLIFHSCAFRRWWQVGPAP